MKKILILLFIICLLYFFRDSIFKKFFISNKSKEAIPLVNDSKFYLINVLDEKDFNDVHIKGSINIPFAKVSDFLKQLKNKDIPLIFYCSNYFCTASDEAAKMAINNKFLNVYVYKGGMAEWYQAAKEDKSFEYEGEAKSEYLEVVILPQENILDPDLDIIDEDYSGSELFKIISINNLQNFLKEGILIK